tara:strand:+ start:670 stop:1008 length:339 start_codon:yes stop_codon:yes gene_type:complete
MAEHKPTQGTVPNPWAFHDNFLMTTPKLKSASMIPIEEHEKLWIEMSPEDSSYESAIKYFKTRMYVNRDMEPNTKLKELRETANVLWSYRNQVVGMDTGDRAVRVSLSAIEN